MTEVSTPEAPTAPADPGRAHRPYDRATLRAAAVELAARGLTYRDIAAALALSEAAVAALLGGAS